jgi:hypothetical protein
MEGKLRELGTGFQKSPRMANAKDASVLSVRYGNGRISPGDGWPQILESPLMKRIYSKLPKTASLPVTCHPRSIPLGNDFLVLMSDREQRAGKPSWRFMVNLTRCVTRRPVTGVGVRARLRRTTESSLRLFAAELLPLAKRSHR